MKRSDNNYRFGAAAWAVCVAIMTIRLVLGFLELGAALFAAIQGELAGYAMAAVIAVLFAMGPEQTYENRWMRRAVAVNVVLIAALAVLRGDVVALVAAVCWVADSLLGRILYFLAIRIDPRRLAPPGTELHAKLHAKLLAAAARLRSPGEDVQ